MKISLSFKNVQIVLNFERVKSKLLIQNSKKKLKKNFPIKSN